MTLSRLRLVPSARVFGALVAGLALVIRLAFGAIPIDVRGLADTVALIDATVLCQPGVGAATGEVPAKPAPHGGDHGIVAFVSAVSQAAPILGAAVAVPERGMSARAECVVVSPGHGAPDLPWGAALARGPPARA